MPRDFSSKVAALIDSAPLELPSGVAVQERPALSVPLLRLAADGDAEAQATVASHLLDIAAEGEFINGEALEGAIEWARASRRADYDTGSILLFQALAFRAGALKSLGMGKLAGLDAAEALTIAADLANEDDTELVAQCLATMASNFDKLGIKPGTADDLFDREIY
jgi:hypothetical protein